MVRVESGTARIVLDPSDAGPNPKHEFRYVVYNVKTRGFENSESLILWWSKRTRFEKSDVKIDEGGFVLFQDKRRVSFTLPQWFKGQAFDIALVDSGTNQRAQAKAIPFPIQSIGSEKCSISVEFLSQYLFSIEFKGFAPGEEVETISSYRSEILEGKFVADPKDGRRKMLIAFGPPDRGKAEMTATGQVCKATVEYDVGADALLAK